MAVEGGYGSPPPTLGSEVYDWGYGSIEPATPWTLPYADAGYGTPWSAAYGVSVVNGAGEVGLQFPDEGGCVVQLSGDWPDPKLAYTVDLVDANSVTWPIGGGGCYSSVPGGGEDCELDETGLVLSFGLPPLPVGVYDIVVSWDGGLVTLEESLDIVNRYRPASIYEMRRRFPDSYPTGPVTSSEPLLEG